MPRLAPVAVTVAAHPNLNSQPPPSLCSFSKRRLKCISGPPYDKEDASTTIPPNQMNNQTNERPIYDKYFSCHHLERPSFQRFRETLSLANSWHMMLLLAGDYRCCRLEPIQFSSELTAALHPGHPTPHNNSISIDHNQVYDFLTVSNNMSKGQPTHHHACSSTIHDHQPEVHPTNHGIPFRAKQALVLLATPTTTTSTWKKIFGYDEI